MLYINLNFHSNPCGSFRDTTNIQLTVETSLRLTLNKLNRQPVNIIKVNFYIYNFITTAFYKHEYVYKEDSYKY